MQPLEEPLEEPQQLQHASEVGNSDVGCVVDSDPCHRVAGIDNLSWPMSPSASVADDTVRDIQQFVPSACAAVTTDQDLLTLAIECEKAKIAR